MDNKQLDTLYELFCSQCDKQRCHGVFDKECAERCTKFRLKDDRIYIISKEGADIIKLSFGDEDAVSRGVKQVQESKYRIEQEPLFKIGDPVLIKDYVDPDKICGSGAVVSIWPQYLSGCYAYVVRNNGKNEVYHGEYLVLNNAV